MLPSQQDNGIARNIKLIEWLKADILASMSALFKGMIKGKDDIILDALASLITGSYILGQRLGISFNRLDTKIEAKLNESIVEGHEVEKWYGDLSSLRSYLLNKKR